MTLTDMRVIVTLVSFICFIGIVLWAFSRHRTQSFDEAAMLPFLDDERSGAANNRSASMEHNNE
jgi:cytochrome c oxidase cbb3-type subunit 4